MTENQTTTKRSGKCRVGVIKEYYFNLKKQRKIKKRKYNSRQYTISQTFLNCKLNNLQGLKVKFG